MKTNTPYDDVHRTLVTDCKHLMISVVNEVFGDKYTGTEEVILLQNEIFLRQQEETGERIQDSSFLILSQQGEKKYYHFECQSTVDGNMILRMYEYDSQAAIQHAVLTADSLEITFPHSAIVYLRHNSLTPDSMQMILHTPGGTVSYDVPVIKAQTYTVDEIFEKKLYYLIPFHIFAYEKWFPIYESNSSKLEELETIFSEIRGRLETDCLAGRLDEYTKTLLIDMTKKVLRNIARKYSKVKKKVGAVMGGQVLMHQAKYWMNKGISQGINQGINQGISQGLVQKEREVFKRMLDRGYSIEEAKEIAGVDEDTWTTLQLQD